MRCRVPFGSLSAVLLLALAVAACRSSGASTSAPDGRSDGKTGSDGSQAPDAVAPSELSVPDAVADSPAGLSDATVDAGSDIAPEAAFDVHADGLTDLAVAPGGDAAPEAAADFVAADTAADAWMPDAGSQDSTLVDPDVCQPECEGKSCGSDGCGGTCGTCPAQTSCKQGHCVIEATNPVLEGDHPDPALLREEDPAGNVLYYLYHTSGTGDIPVYTSPDLVHWSKLPDGAFHRTSAPGASLEINGVHYCALWAPQVLKLGPGSYMLSFSAQRFQSPKNPCPAYGNDGGVYLAWASSPAGPFAPVDHSWEPIPAGGHIVNCPASLEKDLPHSVDWASPNCQGGYCHRIIRLDSEAWKDPATDKYWLAYSWYTNNPPMVEWEYSNHGEHVSLVELDPADPFTVPCAPPVAEVYVANPHDTSVIAALAAYCPGCDQMLSMTKGKLDEEMYRAGHHWGVNEGASFFRRQGYVYMFMSGSAWDAAYYHVFWVAAPTVEGLSRDNADRLVGRYLIPSGGQAFGHGFPIRGPDGNKLYYVHHRLDHAKCLQGNCARDLWVSPLEFEDRGDGKGDVWVTPRWPADTPNIVVKL